MIKKIREQMKNNEIDAILLINSENEKAAMNLFYATGFTGSSGFALITSSDAYFVTDMRYNKRLHEIYDGFEVIVQKQSQSIYDVLNELLIKDSIKKLFVDPYIFYYQIKMIQDKCNVELESFEKTLVDCRNVKSDEELNKIIKACEITDEVYSYLLKTAAVGKTEIELRDLVERKMVELGAQKPSFDTILVSGVNGSSPHGVPSDKKLVEGELVTLDMGVYYEGYASDMTRTFAVGEISDELKKMYETVKEAQLRGVAAAKAGIKASEVDKACRDYITEAGYGEYFTHGTGHGLGIDVHEAIPVGPKTDFVLAVGNVITIEPGIYIDGIGGVRIEDDVVITEDGCKILNKSTKELVSI